ncbi:protein dopey-1 homolog [Scaptodrosophila lebanonensis]|uniref:Protein dopey-1 homolog n=1 Tax=Drosophila lebanonensis TaxID=7225 RepID=A0A6J2UIR9_DROLE|nr:protein dopey-1 homolog [Scaptodrosophila lebanonensis]
MESSDATMEEQKLMSEAKYRNYMTNIDKALRNFEYSSEWADLISALGKLSKAISSNSQYPVIPRRLKISKRLAQCMHPNLPSGVHLKALETYSVIFSKTGPERLASEFIYSAGLFPLLGYAAMNVRPALLSIYEMYFVPLGDKLRPALSGFLNGVLPGYECGLDHFERTSSLLKKVCIAVNPMHFYTVLWESAATNAAIRLPAITYVLEHFNKRLDMREQVYIMGHNQEVMMSALCACLNDSVILVQRNTLEFLLLGFPMHTTLLGEEDLVKLVTNGLNTILRRDMSLNRRLFSWLLGAEVSKNSPTYDTLSLDAVPVDEEPYFVKHSRHILIRALINTLRISLECAPMDLKPYRIMLSLLDKADIGSAVLDFVLCDIIRTMYISSGNLEALKSANLLFATFDPAYIWSFMTNMFDNACQQAQATDIAQRQSKIESKYPCDVGSGDPFVIEICVLTEFLLETVSLEMYRETTCVYLPKVFLAVTQLLSLYMDHVTSEEITASLKLCMKIVSRVQPMITSPIKLAPTMTQCAPSFEDKSKSIEAQGSSGSGTGTSSLEKSKSDSRLNHFADNLMHSKHNNQDEVIRRSASNHSVGRHSPKKKAKSFSRLSELDKDISASDTGQQSSSDLDTPRSIKKIKAKVPFGLRSSPKKTRPKDIVLIQAKADDNPAAKADDEAETVDTPKSAPPDQLEGGNIDSFVLDDETKEAEKRGYSILEKCIRQYEIFFEVYLARKLLKIENATPDTIVDANKCPVKVQLQRSSSGGATHNANLFMVEHVVEHECEKRVQQIERLFKLLRVDVVPRSKQLQRLLHRSLPPQFTSASELSSDSDPDAEREKLGIDSQTQQSVQQLMELHVSDSLRAAVKLAATLLVEMSTFPNCNKHIVLDKNVQELPNWLKVLCLVACFTQADKELQVSAITTLFDLISLLRSQIEHATSPGVTFVVMLPLLKFGHVSYMEQNTRVFQLVTSTLWDYLGPEMDPAQIAALLYQLHSCLESGLVETVIGNRMYAQYLLHHFETNGLDKSACKMRTTSSLQIFNNDRVSDVHMICPSSSMERLRESKSRSYKKFELLWHLGRDKQTSRGFEKTLLKVLDTLALPHYMSERTFVTNWLQASLLRGDLSRLTKPLFKILLAANSKRVGIVHMQHLYREADETTGNDEPNDQSERYNGSFERDVYAISSEHGNIKYHHMEPSSSKKKSPIRNFPKKIFGVTLSGKANKTSNFVSDKSAMTPTLSTEVAQDLTTIGLIINPLENSRDFDDETDFEEPKIELAASSKDEQTPLEEKIANAMDESDQQPPQDEPSNEQETDSRIHFEQDLTDDSDSSDFESDSEVREPSIEKEESPTVSSGAGVSGSAATAGCDDVTRFVGDCATDMMTQHERIKSRKTYRLTREKTPGESSLLSTTTTTTTDEQASIDASSVPDNEHALPADEYFREVKPLTSNDQEPSILPFKKSDKKTSRHLAGGSKEKRKRKKFLTSSDKKRLSCISKTSTDSNNSHGEAPVAAAVEEDAEHNAEPCVQSEDETVESESQTVSLQTISDNAATINVEDKRRNLSLETSKLKQDWELTQKTLEKSKQNVEILRQNAAQNAEELSIRSSTKSCSSLSDIRKMRNADVVHLFHNHLLIYLAIYDTRQTLYAFQTLRNIISCDKRTFLCLSITTSFSSGSLKEMLIRHRKSISGKDFGGSVNNSEYAQSYRGCMHLELLVTLCLFYARGYFHRESLDAKSEAPTLDDIANNRRVQLESIDLLTLICTELIDIVKGMGKGLACYIADLMARCKLQKVILHCLNSSVCTYGRTLRNVGGSFAEQVLSFNDPQDDHLHAECFQVQVLRLLLAVIKLEYEVDFLRNDLATNGGSNSASAAGKDEVTGNVSPTRLAQLNAEVANSNVKYLPNCLISQQPMFLAAVLSALQDERLRHLHRNWTHLVTSSLNCFNFGSLTNIVISVVHQLCNNIDRIAKLTLKEQENFPPDYVVSQLEAVTILCHYCLLDNTQQTALSHLFNQAYPQTSAASQSSNTGQLLNNIVHSFLSSNASSASSDAHMPRNPHLQAARNAVLSHLSRIMTSVAAIWDSSLGQVRAVKQQLMEFLSPVSLHHGCNFLTAVAVTWQERGEAHRRRSKITSQLSIAEQFQRNSMLQACPEQLSLVALVSSIRVMPMDSFVQTLHLVVKSPPPIHRPPAYLSIEVSALELFYFYMKSASAPQLADAWASLLVLIRDGMNLTPPAQFALLMLLNEFVQRCPQMPFQDKKEVRELHDVTSRLVDSLSTVAGACLEQTTWLRRNLAVKEDTDGNTKDNSMGGIQQYSLQAQSVLAAILSNLLDVAYGSQEKDKVVTIVTTLLYNITPYLKNHTARNVPSFYACSALVASLSTFQYTRKAWRKDMLDLMLDNAFFQMDISCLPFWRQILDSLMTYDNTTFRELMTRVSLSQAGSLNIFASRDQEYELRSMLLKRLAFVIYCSEFDQYSKYMPDIQEQLVNSLRLLPLGPSVQAAVFLCFRVLLLRMSPDHVTSLWPIIIAEMVHVFLAMEHELKSESDDRSQQSRLLTSIDMSWSSNSTNNGTSSQSPMQHWRSVQLEACKLLELGCVLPATMLPHFQMYRWAFVGTEFDAHEEVPVPNGVESIPNSLYVPHVRRVARLMDMKYITHSPLLTRRNSHHLMLTFQQIQTLQELYPFFSTLSISCPNPHNFADMEKDVNDCVQEIEELLAKDFLEKLPSNTTPR